MCPERPIQIAVSALLGDAMRHGNAIASQRTQLDRLGTCSMQTRFYGHAVRNVIHVNEGDDENVC